MYCRIDIVGQNGNDGLHYSDLRLRTVRNGGTYTLDVVNVYHKSANNLAPYPLSTDPSDSWWVKWTEKNR